MKRLLALSSLAFALLAPACAQARAGEHLLVHGSSVWRSARPGPCRGCVLMVMSGVRPRAHKVTLGTRSPRTRASALAGWNGRSLSLHAAVTDSRHGVKRPYRLLVRSLRFSPRRHTLEIAGVPVAHVHELPRSPQRAGSARGPAPVLTMNLRGAGALPCAARQLGPVEISACPSDIGQLMTVTVQLDGSVAWQGSLSPDGSEAAVRGSAGQDSVQGSLQAVFGVAGPSQLNGSFAWAWQGARSQFTGQILSF